MLSAAYLAGVPNRPTAAEFAKILRASELNDAQALLLNQVFAAIYPSELKLLISHERLTIHEIARAIHLSGTRRAQVVRWINQFAVPPTTRSD